MARFDSRYAPINRKERDLREDKKNSKPRSETMRAIMRTFVTKYNELEKRIAAGATDEDLKTLRRIVGERAWSLRNEGHNLAKEGYSITKLGCKYISPSMVKNISSKRK